ncbi:MAG: transcription elongation factor NusA [Pyrobaculum sp.]
MAKIPFCEFCVKTRVLCQKCQSLIDSGRYGWLDVEVSDALLKVERKINLTEVEYVKSYEVDDIVIVLMRNTKRIPRGAFMQLEKELSSVLGKSVKVVEHGNVNEVIAQLVSPAKLLTISTSWLPDGTTETVVKIPSREVRRLPIKPERLQAIISQISGANVKVELVKERELRV